MIYLKQSTISTLMIGPFLDSTDGVTPLTGLTIANTDVLLSKNGGTIAGKTDVSSATSDQLGYYSTLIDATDTSEVGNLKLMVSAAGALPVWEDYSVLSVEAYDRMFASTATTGLALEATVAALHDFDPAVDEVITDAASRTASQADVSGITSITVDDIIAGITDGTYDFQEMMRLIVSVVAGKTEGNGTIFRNLDDDKNRLIATLDASGNRLAMTYDGS